MRYIKLKILVILGVIAIATAIFLYAMREHQEREFNGTFVNGGFNGNLHQAKEESGFT
jgi:hypothetical protein